MNRIQVTGQAITSTNYATNRIFNFNPELIQGAAENFLASGVSEIEVPEGVLDPDRKCPEKGIDEPTLKRTLSLLPAEVKMIGTYIGGPNPAELPAFVEQKKRVVDLMIEHFPDFAYGMLHPAGKLESPDQVKAVVAAWAELAQYAASKKDGLQLCLHNHFDSSCETADQVRSYLSEIRAAALPSLRWGPDTGHCHGMRDEYLDVFAANADLIGDFFHIKARVPAFDQLHGGDLYAEDRDIWSNKAEHGKGLYSGFVNVADPEVHTPFKEVFSLIAEKATPVSGVVRGALEIDVPRQHPRLEAMCAVLYLKTAHGVTAAMDLGTDEIVARVFAQ